jgi:hypothetical protein
VDYLYFRQFALNCCHSLSGRGSNMGVTRLGCQPDALLLKQFFGVPQDCRRQDRPICDSEPPRLNRVPTTTTGSRSVNVDTSFI